MSRVKNKKNGFSFIEVLISIFLVLVGIVGVLTLVTKGLRTSVDSRDEAMANLLAQEGVELVRNIRDSNWLHLHDATPTTSFSYIPQSNGQCRIDKAYNYVHPGGTNISCTLGTAIAPYRLYFRNGYYVHNSAGSQTMFYRRIWLALAGGDATTRVVTSMVIWGGSSFPSVANCDASRKCSYVTVTLTNWAE